VINISNVATTHLSISAVERDTGLSKDVLRVWERRYGFPVPDRDANGERIYPLSQVERLRTLKRLLDAGHRPGKLLLLDEDGLAALSARHSNETASSVSVICADVFVLLRQHEPTALKRALARLMLKQGLRLFITDSVTQLNHAITQAVTQSKLSLFHQRTYTEALETLLRSAIDSALGDATRPRVLLTSVTSHDDALEPLMTQALLAPEDVACVSIGANLPVCEIAAAAAAYDTDIVVVWVSPTYSTKQATSVLQTLRQMLKSKTEIWVTGEHARRLRFDTENVFIAPLPADVLALARQWRAVNS
jgi:MerR family transcriptional regulator, light-induced transcriptional regulator